MSDAQPDTAERRALIDRVAASAQFARSARLRDFLLYVGNESLKDGVPEIHEQEIGVRVFGRSPSYDRSQDNIVRVNASELRKRIDAYFNGEGAEEPWIFSIPKGGYGPVFRRRQSAAPLAMTVAAADPLVLPPTVTVERAVRRGRPWGWIAVTATLGVLCGALLWQNHTLRRGTSLLDSEPTVVEFWSNLAKAAPQTDIVLPDASLSMSEEMLGKEMSLNDYLEGNFIPQTSDEKISSDRRQALNTIFGHNLVTLGDFNAAQQIMGLKPIVPSLRMTLGLLYNADSIKSHNVILIGGRKANPWVGLIEKRLNFTVDYDPKVHGVKVTNRDPEKGEQAAYTPLAQPNLSTVYSIVAYLPNPSQTGWVMVLAGTDSDATGAAAEFMTSEEGLQTLKQRFHSGDQLPYFEVLLKVSRLNGTSFRAEPLAFRIHNN
ncbi:MAG: hypothetical protein PW789_05405 [Edaphobacter sp.]|uniref:hypothetical protein n=1 Tax=Edaphobacter sp. TaxID=1934404 RepID=UPI0023881AE4|nr:hypothetical protein [Edaphobacter sp.]MDE1176027.1 hypothetical protein [Edaphobacter sp.]